MTVSDLVHQLGLEVKNPGVPLAREVNGGYCSDLLSNVMANAKEKNVWVTMQGHQNIVAVAVLLGLAAVILAGGVQPDEETLLKAEQEKIPLLVSELPTFELVGRLYQLGVKGVG